jgi:glycosyltransferase involved in cell wall biosynthesis
MPVLTGACPRRILMSVDAVGGVWTYALELARGLSQSDIDVVLAVLGPAPSSEQLSEARQIPRMEVVQTALPLDWTAHHESELDGVAAELKQLADRSDTDLVHLNAPGHASTSPWHRPLVIVAHSCVGTWWRAVREGPLPPDLEWRSQRARIGLGLADAVITPSRSFARDLQAVYSSMSIAAVLNGRDAAPARSLDGGRDIFLTAGRLWDPAKNAGTVDQAAGASGIAVHAAGPLAGPNGERAAFHHLHALGSLDTQELAHWYARTSVFISMSKYEPFGLAVLEAAQSGAALILSDIPTFRELWKGAALFVDANDPIALSEALAYLKSHPLPREGLARQAAERARQYTAHRMVKGTVAVYRRALRQRAGGARIRSVA